MANEVTACFNSERKLSQAQFSDIQPGKAVKTSFLGKMKMEIHGAERWPSG